MDLSNYTIRELKKKLQERKVPKQLIDHLKNDPRKGVQKLAQKYIKQWQKKQKFREKWQQMNHKQLQLHNKGWELIVGLDEAGRGPLAGPVVAGAVILDPEVSLPGLDDSKKINPERREELFSIIKTRAVKVGVGIVDNREIDRINIHQACFQAMKKAIINLNLIPDYLLVDGRHPIPGLSLPQEAVIDGDCKVNAIAAASIIAKVTRDKIIDEYHQKYPQYGFIRNKGYGTPEHLQALKKHGATPLHRYSYSVVARNGS